METDEQEYVVQAVDVLLSQLPVALAEKAKLFRPSQINGAIEGLSLLLQRGARRLPAEDRVYFYTDGGINAGETVLGPDIVARELGEIIPLDDVVQAEILLYWLVEVIQVQPNLLRHFWADPDGFGSIILHPLSPDERIDDLVERWAPAQCGGETAQLISKSAFHLKGAGWYKDGY